MKLVCISDTHNNQIRNLPEGDVLIHAGDLTALGRLTETTKMLTWLGKQKDKYKHVLFVAGNHDFLFETNNSLARQMCEDFGITYLQDQTVEIEGKVFLGSPWTPPFFDWAFMLPEDQLLEKYNQYPEADVLITHGPAYGVLDDADGRCCGSRSLEKALRWIRPRYHVFGHIHRPREECTALEVRNGMTYTAINAAQVDDSNNLRYWKKPVEVEL